MSGFLVEPSWRHDMAQRVGILLVNLGSPEAPTPKALRKYLAQFLSDPRVVEAPRWFWLPLLHGFLLNSLPAKSAAKYAKVWTKQGAPLRVATEIQAKMLAGYFAKSGHGELRVEYAMRYGAPSIEQGLMKLKACQCSRILALPLYPQYASSSTGSVIDALGEAARHIRNLPELRFVRGFHDHPAYLSALTSSVVEHWKREGLPERLLMSFHGLPKAMLDKGDPYFCECHKTARLLAEQLGLKPEQYAVSFQSRFGRSEWLKPYTDATLKTWGREGVKTVDVVCPGFVSDCLETLEEIAQDGRAAFLSSGGKAFRYIEALNTRHEFIAALQRIVQESIQDWLARPVPDKDALALQQTRAVLLGAHQ